MKSTVWSCQYVRFERLLQRVSKQNSNIVPIFNYTNILNFISWKVTTIQIQSLHKLVIYCESPSNLEIE